MKRLLACLLGLASIAAGAEPLKTNARLPEDQIVFPRPEDAKGIAVEAMFKSDTVISEVMQGNWVQSTHLLTYEVIGAKNEEVGAELKFICRDSNPAPDSGIKVKKVAWPFHGGSMTFLLTKDDSCRHMNFFHIVRYDPLLRDAK